MQYCATRYNRFLISYLPGAISARQIEKPAADLLTIDVISFSSLLLKNYVDENFIFHQDTLFYY